MRESAFPLQYSLVSIPGLCYNPQYVERNLENTKVYMVELRFRIPSTVADWLTQKAKENFKDRNIYVRDILITLYRRENGKQ